MEGEEICDEGESNALAQRKCEISIAKQSEEVITKRSKEDSYTREGSEEAIVKGSKDESWTQEGSEQAIMKGSEEDNCEGVMNEKREQSSVGDSRESVSGCEVVAQVKSKTLKKMKEVEFISLQVGLKYFSRSYYCNNVCIYRARCVPVALGNYVCTILWTFYNDTLNNI